MDGMKVVMSGRVYNPKDGSCKRFRVYQPPNDVLYYMVQLEGENPVAMDRNSIFPWLETMAATQPSEPRSGMMEGE